VLYSDILCDDSCYSAVCYSDILCDDSRVILQCVTVIFCVMIVVLLVNAVLRHFVF
jgi:hypothetical protein